jgi:hypothetical protein
MRLFFCALLLGLAVPSIAQPVWMANPRFTDHRVERIEGQPVTKSDRQPTLITVSGDDFSYRLEVKGRKGVPAFPDGYSPIFDEMILGYVLFDHTNPDTGFAAQIEFELTDGVTTQTASITAGHFLLGKASLSYDLSILTSTDPGRSFAGWLVSPVVTPNQTFTFETTKFSTTIVTIKGAKTTGFVGMIPILATFKTVPTRNLERRPTAVLLRVFRCFAVGQVCNLPQACSGGNAAGYKPALRAGAT